MNMIENTKLIQQALIRNGFVVGEADGILGRRTIAAIKSFQARAGLRPDGIVGPLTASALFGKNGHQQPGPLLPWLAEAENLMGTREIPGDRDNPAILDWADKLDIEYPGDEVPWCGLFVAHCIGATMSDEPLPANPLGARNWERFGEATAPRVGAVMCFWRLTESSGRGHVGFYTAEDTDAYRVLGGNQSNRVSHAWVSKNRFTKARWPRSAGPLGGGEGVVWMSRKSGMIGDSGVV